MICGVIVTRAGVKPRSIVLEVDAAKGTITAELVSNRLRQTTAVPIPAVSIPTDVLGSPGVHLLHVNADPVTLCMLSSEVPKGLVSEVASLKCSVSCACFILLLRSLSIQNIPAIDNVALISPASLLLLLGSLSGTGPMATEAPTTHRGRMHNATLLLDTLQGILGPEVSLKHIDTQALCSRHPFAILCAFDIVYSLFHGRFPDLPQLPEYSAAEFTYIAKSQLAPSGEGERGERRERRARTPRRGDKGRRDTTHTPRSPRAGRETRRRTLTPRTTDSQSVRQRHSTRVRHGGHGRHGRHGRESLERVARRSRSVSLPRAGSRGRGGRRGGRAYRGVRDRSQSASVHRPSMGRGRGRESPSLPRGARRSQSLRPHSARVSGSRERGRGAVRGRRSVSQGRESLSLRRRRPLSHSARGEGERFSGRSVSLSNPMRRGERSKSRGRGRRGKPRRRVRRTLHMPEGEGLMDAHHAVTGQRRGGDMPSLPVLRDVLVRGSRGERERERRDKVSMSVESAAGLGGQTVDAPASDAEGGHSQSPEAQDLFSAHPLPAEASIRALWGETTTQVRRQGERERERERERSVSLARSRSPSQPLTHAEKVQRAKDRRMQQDVARYRKSLLLARQSAAEHLYTSLLREGLKVERQNLVDEAHWYKDEYEERERETRVKKEAETKRESDILNMLQETVEQARKEKRQAEKEAIRAERERAAELRRQSDLRRRDFVSRMSGMDMGDVPPLPRVRDVSDAVLNRLKEYRLAETLLPRYVQQSVLPELPSISHPRASSRRHTLSPHRPRRDRVAESDHHMYDAVDCDG
ncbi:hypothetical protein KIPB_001973 [Kipferlia bialata]|uniref:Uncharacterized protein n=1 Tax=Kipferlia bialata TaxID=797122 RepID=A0A9K3GFS0_9EUKA|nr:hypothetical protein KIPB_001973 [Kipferlia bialata]|eukprot:g1973.t1